jgi:hypothetical protein
MNMGIAIGIPFQSKVRRILAKDSFNRADSSTLGNAETGQVWETLLGIPQIKNKTLTVIETIIIRINAGRSDYRVSADISQVAGGSLGLAVRIKDIQNYYAIRIYQRSIELYKFSGAGNVTLLGSYNGTYEGQKNIMVEVKGNTIKAFVNQQRIFTITDNDLMGFVGVGFRGAGIDSYAKNFLVEEL